MGFKNLDIKIKYRTSDNNIPKEFLIPVLKEAKIYSRAVGYFSSTSLLELSIGLCSLAKSNGKIRIIASPRLSEDDLDAINKGYKEKKNVIENSLFREIKDLKNYYEEQRLNLIANLIANGTLELKLAFMENDNKISLYHEKIGILIDYDGNRVSFTGSMNESINGFVENFESIDVYCDWKSKESLERVNDKQIDFENLWSDNTNKVKVVEFPVAIINKLKSYRKSCIDYSIDEQEYYYNKSIYNNFIKKPSTLQLYDYQQEAINNWASNNYCGIFDMATGTGKTFASLGCIENLAKHLNNNIAVFIVCPFIHLVQQWEEDVVQWGGNPIIAHSNSPDNHWSTKLVNLYKRYKVNSKPFICITTNKTFTSNKIQDVIEDVTEDMNILMVADEAHNFGASYLSRFLNSKIRYRLALSATIERYMDKEGTKAIYDFFGDKCIEYTLEKAIKEEFLVNYDYYPVITYLNDYELEDYLNISKQISKQVIMKDNKLKLTELGQMLVYKRSRLVAGAQSKLEALREKLKDYVDDKYIIVYCGATNGLEPDGLDDEIERQIDSVENIIGLDLGMSTHRFTSSEDAATRKIIKQGFADGQYQVITAIRCLDEGVNIPQIRTAFILASSRNPKEFIQRRGRLLRKCPGKKKAIIYDFVTLPRYLGNVKFGDIDLDKALVKGELSRVYEFGRYSINKRVAEQFIDNIQNAYGTDYIMQLLIDELEEKSNV
ncbi:superfamily II DNA or RNA helicase [Sedimentibacter acidaminivorans]|uniref:Superfamily II DNA or RNA helicase n=1 Tax=Sedimentibacter acidaminivorans TaxID=913099 RepID=A0ABS4GC54_9FIRM|nr:superfamily II DNA or RNA helicase [Sedimentibacter acidaminivorans]